MKYYGVTSSELKPDCTDFVDFGKRERNRFGRISWSKHSKNRANTEFLEIKLNLFKMDQDGEIKDQQRLTISQSDFKDFVNKKNELHIAATNFATVQDLQLQPITIGPFARDMETQLKMAHKVYIVVQEPHRKICVTMLRYNVNNPKSSYVQIRLFVPQQNDKIAFTKLQFIQIACVNYILDEFMELLDVMDSARDKILNNQPLVSTTKTNDGEEDMKETTLECKSPTQSPPLKRFCDWKKSTQMDHISEQCSS